MQHQSIEEQTHKGFHLARKLTRQHAKTFYFVSFGLNDEKRLASYSIYAICRISDDSVDQSSRPEETFKNIREKINLAYSSQPVTDDIIYAFRLTIKKYQIPQKYFDELLLGMEMDLTKTRYKNFDELYSYCYRVAGVIGLIMLKIFGHTDNAAEQYAVDLGIAMQLTNILRDIKEDFNRGRIYLPQDELEKFHITEKTIQDGKMSPEWKAFMAFQIQRTQNYYQNALNGISYVQDPQGRFVTLMMADLYGAILLKIERAQYNVFKKRIYLPWWQKLYRLITITQKIKKTN